MYMYMCTCVHIYIYIYLYVCVYKCVYVCVCVCFLNLLVMLHYNIAILHVEFYILACFSGLDDLL